MCLPYVVHVSANGYKKTPLFHLGMLNSRYIVQYRSVYCTYNMYVYQVYILCISNKHKNLVDMFEENDVFLS